MKKIISRKADIKEKTKTQQRGLQTEILSI